MMRWERDGRDWPNRDASRFVDSAPHRWHVQEAGTGPTLLLLHGAGASTHSWRDVFPLLSQRFRVIALDLPGQGFTRLGTRTRCGLDAMAEDLAALLERIGAAPDAVIGHSAGAALGARLILDGAGPAPAFAPINGAFQKFPGLAGVLFPLFARLLSANPFSGSMLAGFASAPGGVRRLLESTGGPPIDERGVALYQRLIADPAHVDATLSMMAQWDLTRLIDDLPRLEARSLFLVGSRDGAVPASVSEEAAAQVAGADLQRFPDLGHLAHEQRPAEMAAAIERFLAAAR